MIWLEPEILSVCITGQILDVPIIVVIDVIGDFNLGQVYDFVILRLVQVDMVKAESTSLLADISPSTDQSTLPGRETSVSDNLDFISEELIDLSLWARVRTDSRVVLEARASTNPTKVDAWKHIVGLRDVSNL